MRFYLTVAVLLLLLIIAFIFGSQNSQSFTLNYIVAQSEITVAAAVSLFTAIGIVIGFLISILWKLSKVLKPEKTLPTQ